MGLQTVEVVFIFPVWQLRIAVSIDDYLPGNFSLLLRQVELYCIVAVVKKQQKRALSVVAVSFNKTAF